MAGVESHRGRLRIYFTFDKKLCREPIHLKDNPENKAYANGVAATIKHELKSGTFKYSRHFPNSKRLAEFQLQHWISLWLELKKGKVAPSTLLGYDRWCRNYIIPKFGKTLAEEIDAVDVEQWIANGLTELSSKSIKDIISCLRQIYILYRKRNRSAANPTDGVTITLPDDDEPDAFDLNEVNQILSYSTDRPGELNAVGFAVWTGPRPSEFLALSWDDVNLQTGEVLFRRSVVLKTYKATKTKRSKRWVDLLQPAHEALQRQYKITGELEPITIDVLQRDNRTVKTESFRPVFVNTNTLKAYTDVKQFNRYFFIKHLEKAGVRHRCVSMCRHTFASQMLSTGVMPIDWICEQLGHTTDVMLRRKYGKYFKRQRKINPVELAKQAFNFN